VQALGDDVAVKLHAKVGEQIEIINVIVPLVNYDGATQDRINALNVEKANTRVAEHRAKTAAAEARANEILAASVSNDPNVLVSKCLDSAREAAISPLGCWSVLPSCRRCRHGDRRSRERDVTASEFRAWCGRC
jgi:hypothetical protein